MMVEHSQALFRIRKRKGRLSFLLMVVLIHLMAGLCHGDDSKGPASGTYLPEKLHFGALNTLYGVNLDDARVAVEINFRRQANAGEYRTRPSLDIIPNVATAAEKIRQGKLHSMDVAVIDYIQLRDMVTIIPLYVATSLSHSPVESFLLLARNEIDLDRLVAMPHRRLMVEQSSQRYIGNLWLETLLHEKGLPGARSFFTTITDAAKPTRLVLPVFFGQAEVCLVPESAYNVMVELNPQLGKKLHVVARSPGFIKSLVVIVDYIDPSFVKEMEKNLQNMHLTADGRQLMMIFRHRRYIQFKPEFLKETERIFKRYTEIMSEPKS